MSSANDLRKGQVIKFNNEPHLVMERVVAVGRGGDVVPVIGEEAAVGLEALDLVVHPEHALGARGHVTAT